MTTLISTFSNGETIRKILDQQKITRVILVTSKKFMSLAKKQNYAVETEIVEIDPFASEETIIRLVHLCLKYQDVVLNITEGTNVMSSSVLIAALYSGFPALYVSNNSVVKLPLPKQLAYQDLTDSAKKLLLEIKSGLRMGSIISQKSLAKGAPAQKLSRPLKQLEYAGLITRELAGREQMIQLTNRGLLVAAMNRSEIALDKI